MLGLEQTSVMRTVACINANIWHKHVSTSRHVTFALRDVAEKQLIWAPSKVGPLGNQGLPYGLGAVENDRRPASKIQTEHVAIAKSQLQKKQTSYTSYTSCTSNINAHTSYATTTTFATS